MNFENAYFCIIIVAIVAKDANSIKFHFLNMPSIIVSFNGFRSFGYSFSCNCNGTFSLVLSFHLRSLP